MSSILQVRNLSKTYASGQKELTVLEGINFEMMEGESLSIVGPSGSGKTTLLGLCAGLDKPTTGSVTLCSKELNHLSEDERAALRNQSLGFIFQTFQLLPTLTAVENVMIPIELQGMSNPREKAEFWLDRVGLKDRLTHYPSQLSGGEQQRVSIARAFINNPKILLADEPTGNLDEETSHNIENLLFDLNSEKHTTLVIVTHDLDLASKTQRVIKLRGGQITDDYINEQTMTSALSS